MKREELAEHGTELNFVPQDAVRWLAPSELKTMGSSILSEIFGNYADKRELQKVFESAIIEVPSTPLAPGEDFWFDYTADIGDGFDATFTVAALMAKERLAVDDLDAPLPARVDARARRRPGVPDRLVAGLRGPDGRALPLGPAAGRPPAAHGRAARQPRLVRRADRVPAAVHPGPLGRAAGAPSRSAATGP